MPRLNFWIARSFILSAAPIVEYTSRFARTVILSRLLIPEEFGISAAIAVLLGVVALLTDVSLDKFVMQTNINDTQTLAAVHMLSVVRGMLVALGLFVAAPATAALFGVPHSVDSFAAAALCPFVGSFNHFRIKQIQRHFHYGPESIAQVAAFLLGLIAIIPAVYFFQDHRAIVASYLMETGVYTVASHILADTPYRLRPNRTTLRAALRYGLPLMINGAGLAMLAQLDRVLVGSWLGVSALAEYTVILTIGVLPMGLAVRVFGPMAFSSVVLQKLNPAREDRRALLMFFSGVISTFYAFYVALGLDWLTPFVFGQSFHVVPSVHILLTIIVFLRMLRSTAPSIFLLATERTGQLAFFNLSAGIGIVCAFWFLQYWLNMSSVLFGLLLGELLAVALFVGTTCMRAPSPRHLMPTDLAMAFVALAIIVTVLVWSPQLTWQARGMVFISGLIGVAAQLVIGFCNHRILPHILKASSRFMP